MAKNISIILLILVIISLIANIFFFFLTISERTGFHSISGLLSASNQDENGKYILEKDIIEIHKDELKKCCSFTNSKGEEDSCYSINNHDCSYCHEWCK